MAITQLYYIIFIPLTKLFIVIIKIFWSKCFHNVEILHLNYTQIMLIQCIPDYAYKFSILKLQIVRKINLGVWVSESVL